MRNNLILTSLFGFCLYCVAEYNITLSNNDLRVIVTPFVILFVIRLLLSIEKEKASIRRASQYNKKYVNNV